jgi:hypothetical protein
MATALTKDIKKLVPRTDENQFIMVDDVRRSMSIGQQAASASGDRHRDSRGFAAPTGESGAREDDRRVHELDAVSSRTRLRTRSFQNRVPLARELHDQEILSLSQGYGTG